MHSYQFRNSTLIAQDILDFAYMAAGRASRLFFSLPQAPAEDVPRADIFRIVFSIFRVGIFSSLFGFLVGEWSIHINISTSAAFCAFGDAWATATELRLRIDDFLWFAGFSWGFG